MVQRPVHEIDWVLAKIAILSCLHDADNFVRFLVDLEVLAESAAARPVVLCHRLVDDDGAGAWMRVLRRVIAAAENRYSHGAEEFRRNKGELNGNAVRSGRRIDAIDLHALKHARGA